MSDESYVVEARFQATGNFEDVLRRNINAANAFGRAVNDNGSKIAAEYNRQEAAAKKAADSFSKTWAQANQANARFDAQRAASAKRIGDAYERAWDQAREANKRYDAQVAANQAREMRKAEDSRKSYDKAWELAITANKKFDATRASQATNKADTDERRRLTGLQQKAQTLQVISQYANQAASSIEAMGAMLVSAGEKFAMFTAGSLIAGGLAGMKLNNTMENDKLSIAGLIQGHVKGSTLAQAQTGTDDLMLKMRQQAVALPGELGDLVNIFRETASGGGAGVGGKSTNRISDLSAHVMGYAMGIGGMRGDSNEIGRQLSMMLSGNDTSRNVLGRKLGINSKEINAMAPEKRADFIDAQVEKFRAGIDAFADTFDAQWSTLIDKVKEFGRQATGGIFDSSKGTLASINQWLDDNKNLVASWADQVSSVFTGLFADIKQTLVGLAPLAQSLMDRVGFVRMPKVSTMAGIGTVLGLMPMAQAGVSAAAGIAGTAGSIAGGIMGGPGGASIGGAAGAGVGTILGGGVMAAGLLSAMGAMEALTDATSKYHDEAIAAVQHLMNAVGRLQDALSGSTQLLDWFGVAMINWLTEFVNIMTTLAKMANGLGRMFGIIDSGPGPVGLIAHRVKTAAASNGILDQSFDPVKPNVTNHHTTINKVEITVASNQDPSRIARMTRQELLNVSRNAGYSKNSQVNYWSGPK